MMSRFEFIRRLKLSYKYKKRNHYSREVSAGFLANEILNITTRHNKGSGFDIIFNDCYMVRNESFADLNLRETEELLKFMGVKYD